MWAPCGHPCGGGELRTRLCFTCEMTAPDMIVAMTRHTGSEAVLNALDAPEQQGAASCQMEPNTRAVWCMLTTVHVVVPAGVCESWEARAKVQRASSSGKFGREKAAD